MCLPVLAVTGDIDVIENSGLDAAGCAVHKIFDLFAMTLVEEGKTIQAGNHVERSTRGKAPTKLARSHLQLLGSLFFFPPRIGGHKDDQRHKQATDKKRK